MKEVWKYIVTAVKGILMGAANAIPGVSGGTIALMTGIYGRLVHSISSFDTVAVKLFFTGKFGQFFKHIDGWFLLSVGLGIVVGTLSLARLMIFLLGGYPIHTWAFFFGLIVASAIFMLIGIKGWKVLDGVFLVAGIALGAVICSLTPAEGTPDALWFVFISGVICICAMILPGISGSFLLLLLGKYEYVFKAIGALASGRAGANDWAIVVVFVLGAAVGILAFSKLLDKLMERWGRQTMIVLAGFMIGSLVKVWPWANVPSAGGSDLHIVGAVIFALVGLAVVFGLEMLSRRGGSGVEGSPSSDGGSDGVSPPADSIPGSADTSVFDGVSPPADGTSGSADTSVFDGVSPPADSASDGTPGSADTDL